MEIIEIIDYHVNYFSENIEVRFRTLDDDDSTIRTDRILFSELDSFGFSNLKNSIISEDVDIDEEDFDIFNFDGDYDDQELLSFLNEYYLINPERLPESELS
jgi:hypothetical protein